MKCEILFRMGNYDNCMIKLKIDKQYAIFDGKKSKKQKSIYK